MPRPIVAQIHLPSLAQNLQVARQQAGNAFVWAVIKANAYGHGIERAVCAFAAADGLALLDLNEAVRAREAGWLKPILLLEGIFEPTDLAVVNRYGLSITVHCAEQLQMLGKYTLQIPVSVYLKMNTGMNRLGFTPESFVSAYQALRQMPSVGDITFMTHFSDADLPEGVNAQRSRFLAATEGFLEKKSLCNSAALLSAPDCVADAVRPGIMLYGSSPFAHRSAKQCKLQAGMSLNSEIIGVQVLKPGDTVGYGSRFKAEQAMRIGVVACGYADGYPRNAPDGTPILVNGVRTRIVGRVSMDMITVDLTPVEQAHIGTTVQLWGEHLPIDEVAHATGTIGYELMCAVAARVPVSSCQ